MHRVCAVCMGVDVNIDMWRERYLGMWMCVEDTIRSGGGVRK